MAAPNQQPPPQGQGGGFDINKLFKPSSNPMNLNMGVAPPTPTTSNLTTSPSFPAQSSTPPPGPPYLTPSSSYPPPTGPYPFHNPHYLPYPPIPQHQQLNRGGPQISYPPPSPPSNPSTGSDILMTFFGNQNQSISPSPSSSDFSNPPVPSNPSNMGSSGGPSPVRLLSGKLPKGRHLIGSNLVYDIDKRMQGEVQPQLEVTPITKYASDPGLVLGRQIAVNRSYICYGLKLGNIRILNINTALRSLLRGHTQRVTDMAFFAEDVHLLASASVDGRVFVWKINEGPDDEDKPQILGKVVIAIQIVGGESIHPRVCWHPHKQEILMVAVGNRIFKIDTMKVGKTGGFTAEEPLNCSFDKLIDGVQFVGKHNGDITELSMCQWLTTRLASASVDGEVKIWDDRRPFPLAVIRPHDGYPVNSATFLTAPHRPDHIVLITGGPLNREVKIWVCYCEDGWLLPTEAEAWRCTQTLELKSSETKFEDSFFNQVVALPRAGLFLLANAKKNAIYAVHIDYGPNPAATCMDYLAEFTVTMPILSLTGTSESLPGGDHSVQVYCVQTQAIQQYALDLSRCFPPSLGNMELEKTDSSNIAGVYEASNSDGSAPLESSQGSKCNEITVSNSIPTPPFLSCNSEIAQTSYPERLASSELTTLPEVSTSSLENKSTAVLSNSTAEHIHSASPPSPRLSQQSSGFRNQSNADHGSEENKAEMPFSGDSLQKSDKDVVQNDISMVPNQPVAFKHPTHLVTPSEILSTVTSSSDNVSQGMNARDVKTQDVVINNDAESVEVEVKVVGETRAGQDKATENPRESHIIEEKREKAFFSQASDLGIQMAKDYNVETYNVEEAQRVDDVGVVVPSEKPAVSNEVEEQGVPKAAKIGDSEIPSTASQPPAAKSKKQKGKTSQVSGPSPSQSPYNSIESSNEPVCSSGAPSGDALPHILAMQDMIEQLVNMQKETQKQMNTIVSSSVNKEGKRLETSLGKNIEKVIKANTDALWARFQEENAKHEKLEKERTHQITNLITNCINKDLPATLEKTLKKEIATVGPVVARSITPVMEKSVASAITESFQKGVGEKAVNQLEKSVISKLEATVARQIQAQFQTSGKQALQDSLRSCLEASVVPAFEMSCKSMFEQIDAAFQKGLVKHTSAAQQQFENSHSQLAIALRDAIGSATSITQTLTGELADGQRKLLAAIAAASVNSPAGNPLITQLSNGPLAGLHEMQPEVQFDPTKELSRLIAERKYDEAFTAALHRSDVTIVSWLCSQVDLQGILAMAPVPLNQGVLLALLQQLACDISNETSKKLSWMTDVAVAINPSDPVIAMHVRPIFDQVYQILSHQRNLPTTSASEASSIRLLTHVINSVLMSYK